MISDLKFQAAAFIAAVVFAAVMLGRWQAGTPLVSEPGVAAVKPSTNVLVRAEHGPHASQERADEPKLHVEASSSRASYNPYSDEILRDGLSSVFGEEGSLERQERLRAYREARFNRYQEQAASGGTVDYHAAFAGMNAAVAEAANLPDSSERKEPTNPYLELTIPEPREPTYFENAARSRDGR